MATDRESRNSFQQAEQEYKGSEQAKGLFKKIKGSVTGSLGDKPRFQVYLLDPGKATSEQDEASLMLRGVLVDRIYTLSIQASRVLSSLPGSFVGSYLDSEKGIKPLCPPSDIGERTIAVWFVKSLPGSDIEETYRHIEKACVIIVSLRVQNLLQAEAPTVWQVLNQKFSQGNGSLVVMPLKALFKRLLGKK